MRTVTLDQAITNLESIIQKTINDHEETMPIRLAQAHLVQRDSYV